MWQFRSRFVFRRSSRACNWAAFSFSGIPSPVPQYISSGVWPWNAEGGRWRLCCSTQNATNFLTLATVSSVFRNSHCRSSWQSLEQNAERRDCRESGSCRATANRNLPHHFSWHVRRIELGSFEEPLGQPFATAWCSNSLR